MPDLAHKMRALPIGRRLVLGFAVLWTMMVLGTGFALVQLSITGAPMWGRVLLVVGLLVCLAVSAILLQGIRRSITDPLAACAQGIDAFARQQFEPVDVEGEDEIGRMGAALNESIEVMKDALAEVRRVSDDRERETEAVRASVDELQSAMDAVAAGDLTVRVQADDPSVARLASALEGLLASLRDSLGGLARGAHALSEAANSVTDLGTQMGEDAQRTSERADRVTTAATEVSNKVHAVSDRAEDLLINVQDIFDNTSQAADVAARGVQLVEGTDAVFQRLRVSSEEIGEVISTITTIAAKTDMLALNATIEAARAGAAGRGFAVVAREVKELAGATAQAAESVVAQIQTIQRDTTDAAASVSQIRDVISQIDSAQSSITASVQEQSQTTSYITMNLNEAATASRQIVDHIATVSEAAAHTSRGATTSLEAAQGLAHLAAELSLLVSKFRHDDPDEREDGAEDSDAPADDLEQVA